MTGSAGDVARFVGDARRLRAPDCARTSVLSSLGRILRIFLAALVLFSCAPASASHARVHFTSDGDQAQLAVAEVGFADFSARFNSGGDAVAFGGLEHHHFCGCPCLGAFPTRSSYETAYSDGMRVRYGSYLNDLAKMFEPAPLRKPPRQSVRA